MALAAEEAEEEEDGARPRAAMSCIRADGSEARGRCTLGAPEPPPEVLASLAHFAKTGELLQLEVVKLPGQEPQEIELRAHEISTGETFMVRLASRRSHLSALGLKKVICPGEAPRQVKLQRVRLQER